MPPRVVRGKTRRATLQAPPPDERVEGETEETQAQPEQQARSSESPQNASNDEAEKQSEPTDDAEEKQSEPPSQRARGLRGEPRGELFSGHKFYLARPLRAERRAELRLLITQNGGEVVAEMTRGAVEIVERGHLKSNEDWVAAEFVEDSIRDGELKDVRQYLAPREEKPRRTPSGRPLKRFFTVEEQAKMLRFLRDEFPSYYGKPSVPERIWKIAAEKKLIDRTSSSMHQHCRKHLVRLTRKERAVILEKAGMQIPSQDSITAETEADSETEPERRSEPVAAKRPRDESSEADQQGARQEGSVQHENTEDETLPSADEEIEGRAKKRSRKSSVVEVDGERGKNQDEETEKNQDEETEKDQEPVTPEAQSADNDAVRFVPEHDAPSEQPAVPAEPTGQHDSAQTKPISPVAAPEDREKPEASGGAEYSCYWRELSLSRSDWVMLNPPFVPPPPPAPVEASHTVPSSAATSEHRTPQRSYRQSTEPTSSQTTPTPQKRRRAGRASIDPATPGPRTPARAAQQELLSQLEEMVGQRMTPPSRRKSLDRLVPVSQATEVDTDEILARLQFETAHDVNTVCSALYWASGDSSVARAFLMGRLPTEIWCPKDDELLADYMHDSITEIELANARHRGAFDSMSAKRSAREILRRIRFLL